MTTSARGFMLTLDTGTTTGWARGPLSSPLVESGAFTAGWEDCSEIQACGSFDKWLAQKLRETDPVAVAIEAPILVPRDKVATVTRLHGIVGVARAACYRHNLRHCFYEYHHKTIKKHATGDPNADKDAMMEAATARGWTFPDDNACDALWILDLLRAELTRHAEETAAGMVS